MKPNNLKAICSLAFLALLPAAGQAALIAHYPFDSDFTDASGGGNDLTAVTAGGATVVINSTAGNSVFGNGAADFTSDTGNEARLDLDSTINFGSADAWSASFWVRRRAGSDQRQGMVAGDTGNTTDFFWASDNPSQVQGMRFRSSANTNANFGGFPDDGNFHHWVVISNGAGTISAYRDNVAQPDVTGTDGSFNITAVGQAYNSAVFSMNGQIDELYIFDEAIDAATVDSLFSSNVVPEPSTTLLLGFIGMALIRRRRSS